MTQLAFALPNWLRTFIDWIADEKSLALATWGLVLATFLLVLAMLVLYFDSRAKGKQQAERWNRDDQLRTAESKPKTYVEIAKVPDQIDVHFRCFNLGTTTFLVDKLILKVSEPKTMLTHDPVGPPILLPGTVASIWFNCAALLRPEGGFREVSAVFQVNGASGVELTEPVWFYFYSDPGEMTLHDWRVGRLSDRLPGALVRQPRTISDKY